MELLIIHITDIHLKNEKDYENLSLKCEFIVKAINKHIIDENNTILILAITGDIAYSGKKEQYSLAFNFFSDIIKDIKRRYNNLFISIVTVPGNHDCNFDEENINVREALLSSNKLNMSDLDTIKICTSIQKEYFSFIDRWNKEIASQYMPIGNGVMYGTDNDKILTINNLIHPDININIQFHCFNTSWCSTKNEKAKEMRLHIPLLKDKLEKDIVITLLHHDDSWLDWESAEAWKKYYKNYADIILVGHDHTSEVVLKDNYGKATNYFIKGNQLYNSNSLHQSGFNILKINLTDDTEQLFLYEWNGELYKNCLDTKLKKFIRNKFLKSKVELKDGILEYIENIEINLKSKYIRDLKLSDIYVYPVLKGEGFINKKSRNIYKEQEEIIQLIEKKKYVIISGEKEFGKTALIKQLYKEFYHKEFYPVLIEIKKIKRKDEIYLNEKIVEFYNEQYNNLKDENILQIDCSKKICIIDNLEDVQISDKTLKEILNYITYKFGIVIITCNFQNEMLNFFKNMETREYLENKFTRLDIQNVRNVMERRLVTKWLLLSDNTQDENSEVFDVLRRNKLNQVKSVMKKGFFNKTPIEFLLILSYLDSNQVMSTDYSRYSYVYECLILNQINEISNKDTNEATMFKTILEQLAFKMYNSNQERDLDECFVLQVIYDYNLEYRGNKSTGINIIDKLIKYKILEIKEEKYSFKHSYMYYYFVGSFIKNQLPPEEKSKNIKIIFSDLSKEINFNVALFLAYGMNIEFEVLPQIREIAQGLLVEYANFNYKQQNELIKKIECDINEKVDKIFDIPENSNIPKIQEKLALIYDNIEEVDENESDDFNTNDNTNNKLDKIFQDVKELTRVMEFSGDILKNYSSSIKKQPRIEIINLIYKSSLKLIGAFYYVINETLDTIIRIVDKRAKENKEEVILKNEFKQKINDFLSQFWSKFIYFQLVYLGFNLQSDRISNEILDIRKKTECTFFKLMSIDYLIRTQNGRLPVDDIKDSVKGKNKLDSFSLNILKQDVASFLKNYQYNEKDKQKVCDLLRFNIRNIFIEEQKSKFLHSKNL